MAAPYHPELFSVEEVMAFFETQKGACWQIFAGSNPRAEDWSRGECTISDKQLAAEKLFENLSALRQNTDNVNPYTIRVFNLVKGQVKDKSSIIFQLNKRDRFPYPGIGAMQPASDPRMIQLMEKMIENQNLLTSKLAAIEMNEEEEDQEPEPTTFLGKLLEKPEIQEFLMNGAMSLVSGFTKKDSYGGGVAGTVDQESVNLLQSLFNKGVNNETLKALDQMSEMKLKSLLMML